MTIKDLQEVAVVIGMENYEIQLQYQDDGGIYSGSCPMSDYEYDCNKETVTLSQRFST